MGLLIILFSNYLLLVPRNTAKVCQMLLYSDMVDVHSKVYFSSFQSLSAFSLPSLLCSSREQWFPENVDCGSWSGHSCYAVHFQKKSSALHGVYWKVLFLTPRV